MRLLTAPLSYCLPHRGRRDPRQSCGYPSHGYKLARVHSAVITWVRSVRAYEVQYKYIVANVVIERAGHRFFHNGLLFFTEHFTLPKACFRSTDGSKHQSSRSVGGGGSRSLRCQELSSGKGNKRFDSRLEFLTGIVLRSHCILSASAASTSNCFQILAADRDLILQKGSTEIRSFQAIYRQPICSRQLRQS
jgi:hypothetical protein